MAIDPVLKVWLICPASQAQAVPEQLARIGLLHVAEAPSAGSEHQAVLRGLSVDTRAAEANIRRLTETLDILGEFSKTARDFLSNLIPTPVETTRKELADALKAIDIEGLHQRAKELAARRAAAQAAAEKARQRLAALERFRTLDVPVPAEGALRWSQAALWLAQDKQARRAAEPGSVPEGVAIERLGAVGGKALVASVALREQADAAASRLRELGFEPVPAPEQSTTLSAYVRDIEAELRRAEEAAAAAKAALAELGKLRHQVELVLGQAEETLETARAVGKMAATGRAALMAGYVRAREAEAFKAAVARELPAASIVLEDPAPGENVPVSLSNRAFFRPAQFLVEMFGLPGYNAFDPSAFLMLSFVVFYGFCLGDAIYGLLQIGLALALLRRYRAYPGLRNFFMLLVYGGVSTFVVGVLTGAWAADLWKPQYLGEGNPLARVVPALAIGDPLEKPLVALGVALAMGVANQFWGVAMRMHGAWRQGDKWGALFDGGFWLILLPGLVLLVAAFLSPDVPAWVPRVGMWLAIVGAAGLVLTQGRNEKSLGGKIVVGLVSLYGVLGTYGCVSFIGDVLSYSRLLALGLTTTIVGMAVNLVASMLRGDTVAIGLLLPVLVAVLGHSFNMVLNALGAFIHSARLIFVEFFGRFYEPGAQRFAPLGAMRGRIRVVD